MQETLVGSLSQEGPLEEEIATHPSTLAWEIPWSEERVGHDCATKQQQIRVSTSNLKFVFIEEI